MGGDPKGKIMLILIRLLKLAVICAIFFTAFDLLEYGKVEWVARLLSRF